MANQNVFTHLTGKDYLSVLKKWNREWFADLASLPTDIPDLQSDGKPTHQRGFLDGVGKVYFLGNTGVSVDTVVKTCPNGKWYKTADSDKEIYQSEHPDAPPVDTWAGDNDTITTGAMPTYPAGTKAHYYKDEHGVIHIYDVKDPTGITVVKEATTPIESVIEDNTINTIADVQALSPLRPHTVIENPDTKARFRITENLDIIQESSEQRSGSIVFNKVVIGVNGTHTFNVNDDSSILFQDGEGFRPGSDEEALHVMLLPNGLELFDELNKMYLDTESYPIEPVSTTEFRIDNLNAGAEITATIHCQVRNVIVSTPLPFGNLIYPSPNFIADNGVGGLQTFTPIEVPALTGITYTATGLPAWASIDSNTGVITIDVTAAGVTGATLAGITVTATDGTDSTTADVTLGIMNYDIAFWFTGLSLHEEMNGVAAPVTDAEIVSYINAMDVNNNITTADITGSPSHPINVTSNDQCTIETANIEKLVWNNTANWSTAGAPFGISNIYSNTIKELDVTGDYVNDKIYRLNSPQSMYLEGLEIMKITSNHLEDGLWLDDGSEVLLPTSLHTLDMTNCKMSQTMMDKLADAFLKNPTLTLWNSSGSTDGVNPIEPSPALKADLIANVTTATF